MRLRLTFFLFLLGTLGFPVAQPSGRAGDSRKEPAPAVPTNQPLTFVGHIKPFLSKYCIGCHGGAKPKADLALDRFAEEASVGKSRKVWQEIGERLRAGEMPPPARKLRPSAAEVAAVSSWIESRLKATGPRAGDPGRVTLRRLNRAEYNNTVRDLVGVDVHPADDFPADDVGYGFDNIGDVLSMPPILLEKYLAAAEKIIDRAFQTPEVRRRLWPGEFNRRNRMEAARKVLQNFATRAYRRPVTEAELNRLVGLVKAAEQDGDTFEGGVRLALQAVLVSPHFLFRVELDPEPNNPRAVHPVNDYELASRLSYFLWSSMPDEPLFALAQKGLLRKDGNLEAQARRMLADPKARALIVNFAGQWLQTRNLKTMSPDPAVFPTFTEALRKDMLTETELFFEAVVKEDRSILDFLDADYSFVNERLARHYGIPGVKGEQFRRVGLAGTPRGGVLTQASILTLTSNPNRTSPVKRGKWILENILGTPIPPPPPNAGELSEEKDAVLSGSLRQRMEQHRANPNCVSCHQRMDPLGFGFENFDAIGAWRDKDGNFPVDPSGTLPGGQSFKGPRDLKAILKTKPDQFRHHLCERLLTYALGRGLEEADRWAVDQIAGELARHQDKFSSLVIAIVQSTLFQMRRGATR
jgi:uncharacterized protein DUF1592/uncharacterized protein DUF1588/uncharacterized protein DUF1587/uncharacterized protein DUF1595/uncharacterized protein DUF1585/cytochrome c